MADLNTLELRIAELETKVRAVAPGAAVGSLRAFSSGSCTNNCTAACTIGCTKGCTDGCGAEPAQIAERQVAQAPASTERTALESYQKLANP
jgi:hypothetical protein